MIEHQLFQSVPAFRTYSETLHRTTSNAPQFIDITDEVADIIDRSGVTNGIVVIFSQHTTAAIKINESEPELLKDMALFLSEIAPVEREYHHNNFDIRTVNMEPDECPERSRSLPAPPLECQRERTRRGGKDGARPMAAGVLDRAGSAQGAGRPRSR